MHAMRAVVRSSTPECAPSLQNAYARNHRGWPTLGSHLSLQLPFSPLSLPLIGDPRVSSAVPLVFLRICDPLISCVRVMQTCTLQAGRHPSRSARHFCSVLCVSEDRRSSRFVGRFCICSSPSFHENRRFSHFVCLSLHSYHVL